MTDPAINDRLVAHYELDESSGGTAFDSAGGNDGDVQGPAQSAGEKTPNGESSYSFDGSDDAVVINNTGAGENQSNISVMALVNLDDTSSGRLINRDGKNVFQLLYDNGEYAARFSDDSRKNQRVYGGQIKTGTWQVVVATFNGSRTRLYVDGDQVASQSANSTSVTGSADQPMHLGANVNFDGTITSPYLDGSMGDARVYHKTLSGAEVQEITDNLLNPQAKKIGSVSINTENGTVKVPLYEPGNSGNNVHEVLRLKTGSGTGFIPLVNPSKATFPYLRVYTDTHGTLAFHDSTTV